jgi:hypothetical protein
VRRTTNRQRSCLRPGVDPRHQLSNQRHGAGSFALQGVTRLRLAGSHRLPDVAGRPSAASTSALNRSVAGASTPAAARTSRTTVARSATGRATRTRRARPASASQEPPATPKRGSRRGSPSRLDLEPSRRVPVAHGPTHSSRRARSRYQRVLVVAPSSCVSPGRRDRRYGGRMAASYRAADGW